MSGQLRLAVFDCDGTLVDSQHAILDAMGQAFAAQGLEAPDPSAVRAIIGLELMQAMANLLPAADEAAHRGLRDAYRHAAQAQRAERVHEEPLFPGAREAIEDLVEAGWLLGVATGKSSRGLAEVLARHGIDRHFVTTQTSDTAPGKPAPGMLLQAMRETGVGADRVVMIGDTTFDMQMAQNARARALGVAWGYHDTQALRAAGAQEIVHVFAELPAALEGLLSEGTGP